MVKFYQKLVVYVLLWSLFLWPNPVIAQLNFGVGATISESDEWIISEIASSNLSIDHRKVSPRESVRVTLYLESFGKPVVNKQVKLVFEHDSNLKKEIIATTNEGGVYQTTVASNRPGKIKIRAYSVVGDKYYKMLDEESLEILNSANKPPITTQDTKVFLGDEFARNYNLLTPLIDFLTNFFH